VKLHKIVMKPPFIRIVFCRHFKSTNSWNTIQIQYLLSISIRN
jgi:hypothetical protein